MGTAQVFYVLHYEAFPNFVLLKVLVSSNALKVYESCVLKTDWVYQRKYSLYSILYSVTDSVITFVKPHVTSFHIFQT